MNQIDHYIKVKKPDVSFVCNYFEVFEGMAAIRTPNPKMGEDNVLHVMVSPDFENQFNVLLAGLQKYISLEEVEP